MKTLKSQSCEWGEEVRAAEHAAASAAAEQVQREKEAAEVQADKDSEVAAIEVHADGFDEMMLLLVMNPSRHMTSSSVPLSPGHSRVANRHCCDLAL